jgi:phage terminase large subunit-like protein
VGDDADHFLVVFYALDNEDKNLKIKADDEFDETNWIKANPLMTVNPELLVAIRKEAVEAKSMPSKLSEFRIKRLNRPASVAGGWVNLTKWNECSGKVDLDFLEKHPCFGGLDLASSSDLASFRMLWNVDGKFYTHGWRFVPRDGVVSRTSRGTVPYEKWVNDGMIIQTDGNIIDYKVIEKVIVDANERFQIKMIGYDRWNATDLVTRLLDSDVPLIEFVQGTKSFHPAMRLLEEKYMTGKLAHGGDAVLSWCASNLVSRTDVNNNNAPDRKNSSDKIDDMVALLMAVGISASGNDSDEEDFNGFLKCPIII